MGTPSRDPDPCARQVRLFTGTSRDSLSGRGDLLGVPLWADAKKVRTGSHFPSTLPSHAFPSLTFKKHRKRASSTKISFRYVLFPPSLLKNNNCFIKEQAEKSKRKGWMKRLAPPPPPAVTSPCPGHSSSVSLSSLERRKGLGRHGCFLTGRQRHPSCLTCPVEGDKGAAVRIRAGSAETPANHGGPGCVCSCPSGHQGLILKPKRRKRTPRTMFLPLPSQARRTSSHPPTSTRTGSPCSGGKYLQEGAGE